MKKIITLALLFLGGLILALMLSSKPAEKYYETKVRIYLPNGRYEIRTYSINARDTYTAKARARELALRQIRVEVTFVKELKPRP